MDSIPKLVVLRVAVVMIVCAFALPRAQAVCADQGILGIAGQIPDVTFTSGLPSMTRVNPWWASFQGPGWSCGVLARSTAPGVSVQDTYGCPPGCKIHPPGEWAAVEPSYPTAVDRVTRDANDIPLIFDGKTPRGTHGTLEIGIIDNDLGIEDGNHISIIYTVNIYIESAAPPATWFTILSAPANISGDQVLLNHPYLNGKPGALIFISHVWNPNGAVSGKDWNHAIAVHYDTVKLRWTIRNVDGAAMPAGLGFNVRIDPTAFRTCKVGGLHTDPVVIDNRVSNNTFWATVLVTPIDGSAHPIAVRYAAPNWQIVYYDGGGIGANTCFNVKVFWFTQYIDDPAVGDLSNRQNAAVNVGLGEDMGGSGIGNNVGSNRLLPFAWAQALPIFRSS